jgi:Tfp pilus assembly protein PilF
MALDVQVSPEELRALCEAGFLYREKFQFAEAREIFEGVLTLRPELEAAHLGLANVLQQLGENDAAQASFEQATALHEGSANAWAQLGEFHYTQGRKDQAIECLDKATSIDPSGPFGEAANQIKAAIDEGIEYTYSPS